MPTRSLRSLARYLDVPERTLRRAAGEGLLHGRRASERRFEVSLKEEAYLRKHWTLLHGLRAALRTEPNVRLAVLFGSQATGEATPRSDVDLLVALRDPGASRVAELTGRLERRIGRAVQIVRLEDAESSPALMADALRDGRVLVDRERRWAALRSQEVTWRRRAAASQESLEQAAAAIEL